MFYFFFNLFFNHLLWRINILSVTALPDLDASLANKECAYIFVRLLSGRRHYMSCLPTFSFFLSCLRPSPYVMQKNLELIIFKKWIMKNIMKNSHAWVMTVAIWFRAMALVKLLFPAWHTCPKCSFLVIAIRMLLLAAERKKIQIPALCIIIFLHG